MEQSSISDSNNSVSADHVTTCDQNGDAMTGRIAFLSEALAAQSLADCEALDGTLADGID